MATVKTCDVCGGSPIKTVTVAVDTTNNSDQPIGNALVMDLCEAHRSLSIDAMVATIKANLEAAIVAV